ncbi:MAG: sulfotransferase domain-containing protein [Desulfosoma sp.]
MKYQDLFGVLRGMIHFRCQSGLKETVLLAGFPRGGTTWLSEIINYWNDYRYMFEPFYSRYVPSLKKLSSETYLRPGDNVPWTNLVMIDRIMTGRIRNPWIDRFNRKICYENILIKDIRIHLALGWLKERFPALKVILLLRHPFAVAVSLQKIGWRPGVKKYCRHQKLVEDYLKPYVEPMLGTRSDFERYVFSWCVEHYVPLKQFAGHPDVYVCFYEWFCMNVLKEAVKLLKWLGKPSHGLIESRLRRPSKMSKKHSAVYTGEDLVRSWTRSLSQEEVGRGVEILRLFKLDCLYDANPFPHIRPDTTLADLALG